MSADDFDAKLLKLSEDFQAGLMIQSEFEARLMKLEQESAQAAAPVASGDQPEKVRYRFQKIRHLDLLLCE
jgi:hypothetical protein